MSKANKKEARELGENCFSYSGPLGEEYFGGPLAHGPPGCGAAGRSWAFLRPAHGVRGAEPGSECPPPKGRPECRAPRGRKRSPFRRLTPCAHAVPWLSRHGGRFRDWKPPVCLPEGSPNVDGPDLGVRWRRRWGSPSGSGGERASSPLQGTPGPKR